MTRGVEVSHEVTPMGCWFDNEEMGRICGLNDCPRDKDVDKNEELNVLGGATTRLGVKRE